MKREDIRAPWGKLVAIFSLFVSPIIIAFVAILITYPEKLSLNSTMNGIIVASIISLSIGGVFIAAIALRHTVVIEDDRLIVSHSFYTLVLLKTEIQDIELSQIETIRESGITIRRNGIAAFGFYSGLFGCSQNGLGFCAISAFPAHKFVVKGNSRFSQLFLSCSGTFAKEIYEWGKSNSRGSVA